MDVIPLLPTSTDGAPIAPPAACAGCGAPLAPDQRYCLACGRPVSPVRLAFLDVLQAEPQTAGTTILGGPSAAGYQPPADPPGTLGSLRRYSGLFGLLGVLLASLLIGLLVGHWLTGSNGNGGGKQVVEIKGLSAPLAAAGSSTPSGSAGTSTGSGSSGSGSSAGHHSSSGSSQSHTTSKSEGGVSESSAEEAEAAKEVKSTKALPAAHKTSSSTLQKLEHTTGKQHAKEVKAALGNGPIETH
ncbi:MAG: zinc ribbon domain-containing protein [Solirubrobacteraceae bacterium]